MAGRFSRQRSGIRHQLNLSRPKRLRQNLSLDLVRFNGEVLDQLAAIFSNWAGLVKSSAEWRRTGL